MGWVKGAVKTVGDATTPYTVETAGGDVSANFAIGHLRRDLKYYPGDYVWAQKDSSMKWLKAHIVSEQDDTYSVQYDSGGEESGLLPPHLYFIRVTQIGSFYHDWGSVVKEGGCSDCSTPPGCTGVDATKPCIGSYYQCITPAPGYTLENGVLTGPPCAELTVPNSDFKTNALTGNTGEVVQVTCDGGYYGGGPWTCGSTFTGAACTLPQAPSGSHTSGHADIEWVGQGPSSTYGDSGEWGGHKWNGALLVDGELGRSNKYFGATSADGYYYCSTGENIYDCYGRDGACYPDINKTPGTQITLKINTEEKCEVGTDRVWEGAVIPYHFGTTKRNRCYTCFPGHYEIYKFKSGPKKISGFQMALGQGGEYGNIGIRMLKSYRLMIGNEVAMAAHDNKTDGWTTVLTVTDQSKRATKNQCCDNTNGGWGKWYTFTPVVTQYVKLVWDETWQIDFANPSISANGNPTGQSVYGPSEINFK